jgi:soluble lytic murein transglycosylase-like protein
MPQRPPPDPRPPARLTGRRAGLALLGLLLVSAAYLSLAARGESAAPLVPVAEPAGDDPLAFDPGRTAAHEQAAAEGLSHVLHARSPGGAVATAQRVAAFREQVEAAADGSGLSPDLLEAIVFLESAGRPDVIAGADVAAAAGLAQIVAETGIKFLGMPIRLERSRQLTRELNEALRRRDRVAVARLREERRRADPRFDPEQALAAMVLYLTRARALLGRDDLAVASYHMGIGNLQGVLRRFAELPDGAPVREAVEREGLSWARVFFDSAPDRRPEAWRRLNELGDDTRHYFWKVLAAEEIMRLHRADPEALAAVADLHARKASHEEVLHPPDTTERLQTPRDVERAWDEGGLHPLPHDPDGLGIAVSDGMGSLAGTLGRERELYRGLRAEALAVLVYTARRVRELSGDETPIVVTSTVRDQEYQDALADGNVQATLGYSLHTTGYAFDLSRRWGSPAQAAAMQFVLERLRAHGLIAWVREPGAIHVTAGPRAAVLVPWLLREAEG